MKAMLLAAGRGERMRELTHALPKPLLEVGGESLLERQLRLLASAGIREIVINLSYLGAVIRKRVGARTQWGQTIAYSEEGEPPLETAGGIVAALPLLGDEPFLLVNADIYTSFDYGELVRSGAANHLVLVPNPTHHLRGDFGLDHAGRVTLTEPLLTFAGISVLSPMLFAGLAPGRRPLRPLLEAAIARRELTGERFDGIWEDVGTPERLDAVRRLARA